MISTYKLRIIIWYTGLLLLILLAVFFSVYSFLKYELRNEIDHHICEQIGKIERILRDPETPPRPDESFYSFIISEDHFSFYDIREHTDVVDNKFLLAVYCGDSLMYFSKKYQPAPDYDGKNFRKKVSRLRCEACSNRTLVFGDTEFSLAAIHKTGYSVYVGYDLSTIIEVKHNIRRIFLIVLPFGIILSVLCGFLVTQRSLKVIKQITETAASISSRNLGDRISVSRSEDEINNLIVTLNSMIDRLEKSFNLIQQFSHDAAHEIRTPLTIIQGQIEELLGNGKAAIKPQKLESILEEVQYLSSVSDKLLLIHTLDTSEIEYHFTEIGLNDILSDILADASILSDVKQIGIETGKCDPARIKGNEELIVRLLWNLIDNAIKYSESGDKIEVGLEQRKSQAVLTIADTGIGIPPGDLDKIFDRFYRVDKSRSRKLGGSGLGLAICKWIAELHHGTIGVESEVGKGTRFTVKIPLA